MKKFSGPTTRRAHTQQDEDVRQDNKLGFQVVLHTNNSHSLLYIYTTDNIHSKLVLSDSKCSQDD